MSKNQTITTEDGVTIKPGVVAYNYYDMKVGSIQEGTISENGGDLWFRFVHADGSGSAILNGARICSIRYAERRGFKGAKEYLDDCREVIDGQKERRDFYRDRDYRETGGIR